VEVARSKTGLHLSNSAGVPLFNLQHLLRVTERDIDEAFDSVLRERQERKAAVTKWIREEYAPYQGKDAHRHAFHRPIISIGAGS
jgi:hypothetical protein